MKTLLCVSAVGGHGGPVASLRSILPGLQAWRRVCVGAWRPKVEAILQGGAAEVVVTIPRPRGKDIARAVWVLRRAIREHRPDLIFANGLTEASITALALTALGEAGSTPVWVWVHNSELPQLTEPSRGFIRRKSFRWAAVSQLAADLVGQADLGGPVEIVPNPISNAVVAHERVPSQGRLRVAYLGTDRAVKGFDYLAPIIERTRHLPITWRLHLPVRPVPVWDPMRPLLEDEGLDIQMAGRVEPVCDAYGEADVVLVLSRQESFCRVAGEAQRNGLPVIASDLQPLRTVVGHEVGGLLVPPGDVQGFANALERLCGDPVLQERLGRVGRERSARFDTEAIWAKWQALLES